MSLIHTLHLSIGLPEDQIRMIIGLLSTVPLGFIYKQIPNPFLRQIIGLILGIFFTLFVYGYGIINVLVQSVIVYELTKRIKLKGPINAKVIFIQTMLYVSAHHIYRQITDYGGWSLDITTILMINCAKWTSFAYCYQDGLKNDEDLIQDQKERKITKLPSYFDYFTYIFFFFGCLAGPVYDYYDYDIFVNRKAVYSSIPNTIKETFRLFMFALIYSALYIFLLPKFDLESVLSDQFKDSNILIKIIWFNATITLMRAKYVAGWFFSEIGFAAAGFTYNGTDKDGSPQWLRIRQIDPILDFKTNPQDKIKYWNIAIQQWLRRYVYNRFFTQKELEASPSKRSRASLYTFIVSGFWHGFYPAYYLSFFQWGLVDQINKYQYKLQQNSKILSIFDSNKLMQFVKFFAVNSIFNAYGIGFQLLNISDNIKFYQSIQQYSFIDQFHPKHIDVCNIFVLFCHRVWIKVKEKMNIHILYRYMYKFLKINFVCQDKQ
ncbi:hypothetical protein pb186bvf_000624 [Paramecium bursaria]